VAPLEREHERFLGADHEKHIVDANHRQVHEYREVVEEIRKKSVEVGFYRMTMPEEVGGGDVDVLTRDILGEHVANRKPGCASAMFGGAGFIKNQPIERQYRAARVLRIFEGTDEIQQRTIARELM